MEESTGSGKYYNEPPLSCMFPSEFNLRGFKSRKEKITAA